MPPKKRSGPESAGTSPRVERVEEKRLKALELRIKGHDYPTIGQQLHWTAIEAKAEIDLALGVYKMERIEGERQLDSHRYDGLIAAWWEGATKGDKDAADTVLKALNQRARLLGLNVPERHELTGKDGAPIGTVLATTAMARDLVKEVFGDNALPPEPDPEKG